MAVFANNDIMDAALQHVIDNAEEYIACEGQPSTYSDATTAKGSGGNKLGSTTIGAGDFSGPTDGASGRQITVSAQSEIDMDEDGDVDHIAIVDNTNSELLLVTTCDTVSVTSDGVLNTDSFTEEIESPVTA